MRRLPPPNPFEPATPSAGSLSAVFLPRAETPAPLRPHGGAGTPSLLAAALERRTLHPLVEEVRIGPPRVFHYSARLPQPRASRRLRLGRALGGLVRELAGAAAMALFLTAFFTLLALATLPTSPDAFTLQAEARP